MRCRRAVIWVMIQALLIVQTAAIADASHDQGVAAGRAANTATRGMVNQTSAADVVPGYTTTPSESGLAGRPSLGADARARIAACAGAPDDTACQGITTAIRSADTARPAISPADPAVAAAARIARNPSVELGDLSAYYSGCTTSSQLIPARTEIRSCTRRVASGSYSCANSLTVAVDRSTNCEPGAWFAQAASGAIGMAAQCLPDRPASAQHLRVTSKGEPLAFFDTDMTRPLLRPARVASSGPTEVWIADPACTGDACSVTGLLTSGPRWECSGGLDAMTCVQVEPFLDEYGACPAGTLSGDHLSQVTCTGAGDNYTCTGTALPGSSCYAPAADAGSGFEASATGGTIVSQYWRLDSVRPVVGWRPNPAYGPIPRMRLNWTQPAATITTTDSWTNQCPDLAGNSRCSVAASPLCADGPSTRTIDGVQVTRDCWQYRSSMTCTGTAADDPCAPLAAAGCTPTASTCAQTDTATGTCRAYREQYACPAPAQTLTQVSNCPANVFCFQGNCYNTSYTNDADFARSMSMLEAAREAGVYLDTDRLQVFRGEADSCRDRLLTNCCNSDPAGRGMTNQSVFGAGSSAVYDILMNSQNQQFVTQGLSALLTSSGFSGSFSSYGVTVAVNGTALPAGSTVLYSSSQIAGEGFVLAFDPWSLAIAAVVYVVMSMTSCSRNEAQLALKEGARLCRTIGTYCSSCIRVLGKCVSCIEHTTGKCCFNSVLARVVNEQGRTQVGKGWGSATAPDCSGFTVAQLQTLDFARMDLSEFYASLTTKTPDVAALQNQNAARIPNCYYGQGKC